MNKKINFIVIVLVCCLVLSACSGVESPVTTDQEPKVTDQEPSGSVTEPSSDDSPKTNNVPKDEVVTMAIISSWNTLNIYNVSGSYGHCVADHMFERMVTVTHDGEYKPRLAESWEMTDDNKSAIFHLTNKCLWHDGEKVTADDVVFTVDAMTNVDVDNYYRGEFSILEGTDDDGICHDVEKLGVEAIDEYTVKLTFKSPKEISDVLSSFCSYLYVLPKHILDSGDYSTINQSDFWTSPVGSGPFKYVRDIAGEELELTANEDYYLGVPDFKTLIVRVVPAANLTVGLLNGEIDVVGAGNIPLSDWETVKNADNLVAEAVSSYSYQYMQFNLSDDNPDFQDAAVRVAIDKAINKQLMVDQLMVGEGQVAVGPMPPYHPYFNGEITGNKYDPDAALRELEAAGFNFDKEYRIIVPQGNQVREQSALIIQQNFKDIGINLKIETYDFPTTLEMMRNGDFDFGLLGGGTSIDPFESAVIVKPNCPQNYSLTTNSKWYDLANEGNGLLGFEARKEAFDAYQQALFDDQPYIWLYHQDALRAHSKRIETIPMEDFIWYNYEVWTWKLKD